MTITMISEHRKFHDFWKIFVVFSIDSDTLEKVETYAVMDFHQKSFFRAQKRV
jgi:hypothetical protein